MEIQIFLTTDFSQKMKELIPTERHETIRQEIIKLLEERSLAASALSKITRRPEKEVYSHLEQIKKSGVLSIIPAECSDCGFKFKDRNKVNKPGRCPKCKGTFITPPLFTSICAKGPFLQGGDG